MKPNFWKKLTAIVALGFFLQGTALAAYKLNPHTGKWDYYEPSGSGAPTDADYLVGTSNGSLSGEIVVGTSPGGELGGTWGSPTIDDGITIDAINLTGGADLSNGATSAGYLDFFEDSDNGSNRARVIGPASTADVTLTLPATTGTIALTSDITGGVGGSTGSTDNAMLRADGTGGATAQSSVNVVDDLGNIQLGTAVNAAKGLTVLDSGTYATSGTLTYGGTNNTWVMSAPGLIDSGANYPPAFEVAINSSGLNTPAYAKIQGSGVRNGVLFYGGGYYGGLIAGRMGTQSGAGLVLGYGTGAGAADEWNSIVPATIPNTDNADPTRADNTVNLGRASYQFKNFYSVLGTFSGNVTMAGAQLTTTTVGSLGTATAGLVKAVTNAADATDCVTGSGSTFNVCVGNGSTWQDLT